MADETDAPEAAGETAGRRRNRDRPKSPVTIDLAASTAGPTGAADARSPAENGTAPASGGEASDTGPPVEDREQTKPGDTGSSAADAGETKTGRPDRPSPVPGIAAPPPTRPGRAGYLGLVVAGVVGGVIATVLGIAWHATGIVPTRSEVAAAAADAKATATATAVTSLETRLAALEKAPAAASAGEVASLGEKVAAAESAIASVSARLDQIAARPAATTGGTPAAETLAVIDARLGALEAKSGDGSLAVAVTALDGRLTAAEAAVAALTARIESLAADGRAPEGAARTVAAQLVRQAAADGRPFAADLALLAAFGGKEADVEALRPYAERGVPDVETITAAFPAVANAILAASSGPGPGAGVLDRLASYGRSLVSVRPTVAIEGDTPAAIVSRMQAAVDRGDLAAALAERKALPAAGQEASAAWAAMAADRIALDALVARVAGPQPTN